MSKLKITILLAILAIALLGLDAFTYVTKDRTAPTIDIPASITGSKYEKDETKSDLLKGVTAQDNRSGDVTDTLRVSDILENVDGKSVTITYVAKDEAKNIASESIVLKKA